MKASMSNSLTMRRVGVKIFLARGCREKVLVIKEEIESVEGFRGEAQERRLVFDTGI